MTDMVPLVYTPPKFAKIVHDPLFLTCNCEDSEYGRERLEWNRETFSKRLDSSQNVRVAKWTNFLVPPEVEGEVLPGDFVVTEDELNTVRVMTLTVGKTLRTHVVRISEGDPDNWVCKHVIAAAKWYWQYTRECSHVLVCYEHDTEVERMLKIAGHMSGDLEIQWARIGPYVWLAGW